MTLNALKRGAQTYEDFAKDKTTRVNANTLYPYDIVRKALANRDSSSDSTDRKMIEKYWNNQKDYLNGNPCKMMCVVDTSGSMGCSLPGNVPPIDIAISLGMYCAERVGGDFKNHYISFSRNPQLITIEGVDFVDKVRRIYQTNLCENTDLIKTFEMLRKISLSAKPEDRLDTVVVISDMEIDEGIGYRNNIDEVLTEMEAERKEWELFGLKMPRLVYWNVNARHNTILEKGNNVAFVSGASPSIFESILSGKDGYSLMMDKLNSKRYEDVK